jgi:hypothetical protein
MFSKNFSFEIVQANEAPGKYAVLFDGEKFEEASALKLRLSA